MKQQVMFQKKCFLKKYFKTCFSINKTSKSVRMVEILKDCNSKKEIDEKVDDYEK